MSVNMDVMAIIFGMLNKYYILIGNLEKMSRLNINGKFRRDIKIKYGIVFNTFHNRVEYIVYYPEDVIFIYQKIGKYNFYRFVDHWPI